MGYTGLRTSSESKAEQTDDSASHRHHSSMSESVSQSTARSTGTSSTPTRADIESRYDLELYAPGQEVQLQRLEQACGPGEVQGWVDEGMPVEIMGQPIDMDAFRERQAERPAAVPKDIERRNAASVQRSREAQYDTDRAGDAGVPASVREVLSTPGQPLDGGIQRAMEDRMGDSLGDVRIHADGTAARACEDINARAFTVGNHIAFNHGEYEPESAEGQHLLAHELAHVRQQTGAAISMLPQDDSGLEIDPDPRLEREAEDAAQQAMADGPVTINRMGAEMHIQRSAKGEGMLYEAVEDLQSQVEGLEDRQSHIMEVMLESTPGAPDGFDLKGAAIKGVTGFAAGASAGAFLGPGAGITGLGGAIAGMTSAVAGDVTKETVGTLLNGRPGGNAEKIEEMYLDMAKMYEEFIESREDHADSSQGVLNMGEVTQ